MISELMSMAFIPSIPSIRFIIPKNLKRSNQHFSFLCSQLSREPSLDGLVKSDVVHVVVGGET